MKRFVSMREINGVFSKVDQVDYVTVSSVNDARVSLDVHLKTLGKCKEGSSLFNQLEECCQVLGGVLDRAVSFSTISSNLLSFFTN